MPACSSGLPRNNLLGEVGIYAHWPRGVPEFEVSSTCRHIETLARKESNNFTIPQDEASRGLAVMSKEKIERLCEQGQGADQPRRELGRARRGSFASTIDDGDQKPIEEVVEETVKWIDQHSVSRRWWRASGDTQPHQGLLDVRQTRSCRSRRRWHFGTGFGGAAPGGAGAGDAAAPAVGGDSHPMAMAMVCSCRALAVDVDLHGLLGHCKSVA